MHLPRSVFSVRQSELFLWLLRVNGIQDATSVKTMKDLDAKLQGLYGIQTFEYKGAFGHTYYVNSLADIVSQVYFVIPSNFRKVLITLTGNVQSACSSTPRVLS